MAVVLKFGLADAIAVEHVLLHIRNSFQLFTCEEHKEKEQKFDNCANINIYFNDKRKLSTASVMKDNVKTFKGRQREMWNISFRNVKYVF